MIQSVLFGLVASEGGGIFFSSLFFSSPPFFFFPCRNEAVLILFVHSGVEEGRKFKFVAVFFKCDGERTGA